jgi:G3E family GTPase
MAEAAIPITVVTGFLGSGKTTLLNGLLRHAELTDTAVIVNEFGAVGLDHALIEGSEEDTILLSSGCLCCTVRTELTATLADLLVRRRTGAVPSYRRVVVETTGLADPRPIMNALLGDPSIVERYRLDQVICTVDAVNGARTLDQHAEAVAQVAIADRVLLTKTDIAADTASLLERLDALNPGAAKLIVTHGNIAPDLLFGSEGTPSQRWAYRPRGAREPSATPGLASASTAIHDEHVRSFCLVFDRPFYWIELADWLDRLGRRHGEAILRIKGIVDVVGSEQPVAVHGAQGLFHPPRLLSAWPGGQEHRSQIVFITRDLDRAAIETSVPAPAQPCDVVAA